MKKKNDIRPETAATEYVLCPKCELNYISKRQHCCDVCARLLKADGEAKLFPEEEEELEKLCPVCKVNFMNPDDEMCFICAKELADKAAPEEDADWHEFVEDEETAPIESIDISFDELAKEEELAEEEDEDEEFKTAEDDFEYVDPDEDYDEDDDLDDDEE
jgi:hypothetical protein